VKGKKHYIEVDLREGWVLAGLMELERLLRRHAAFWDYLGRSGL